MRGLLENWAKYTLIVTVRPHSLFKAQWHLYVQEIIDS